MPSISFGLRPASFIALSAASAWSISCDVFRILPISVVSAAPTTATVFCFIVLPLCRTEFWQADFLACLFEGDFEGHVEGERFRCLRAIDDVCHHARTFFQRDDRNGMRLRAEIGARAMIDDIGIKSGLAACLVDLNLARATGRAKGPGREVAFPARRAALQPQFFLAAAVPEMLCLGRRRGQRAIIFRHFMLPDILSLLMEREDNGRVSFGKCRICCLEGALWRLYVSL